MPFDVIVIGSGFGGAITACRLAQAGRRVLVLERGRRWGTANFPRRVEDPWLWSHRQPEVHNGWLDLRRFPRMTVAQGAAVGGGSLIYANVSCEAPPQTFSQGWPADITYAALKTHYATVADVMDVQVVPKNQWTRRMDLMKDAADASNFSDRFRQLELAVRFDPNFTRADIGTDPSTVQYTPNKHGASQGHCIHLGNCDIGCDVLARNTLDLNYLYLAEKKQADVRELCLVDRIESLPQRGYRVRFDRLKNGQRLPDSETAETVIVAAGSLGSTELLLRARDVYSTLPNISQRLGQGWSANGDFLTPAIYPHRQVDPCVGPTIASAIDFHDDSQGGQSFWIQDGGFPSLAIDSARRKMDDPAIDFKSKLLLDSMQEWLRDPSLVDRVMPWFAQGVDAGDGTLSLDAPTLSDPGGTLRLSWDPAQSEQLVDRIIDMHKLLSRATDGIPVVPPYWTLFRDLITPHPLGGCGMGTTVHDGVVDSSGRVFGYQNLYVADGAIVPRPLGVNPSRTIGALAEHIAAAIVRGN